MTIKHTVTVTRTVTKTVSLAVTMEEDVNLPRCPKCGESNQLSCIRPGSFPVGKQGFDPVGSPLDGPEMDDTAICHAVKCGWQGEYGELVVK